VARRRYLVAYDIADDARLRRVHSVAKAYGYSLQYSVFLCDLDRAELVGLKWRLGEEIKHSEDRVVIIDLGDADFRRFQFMGIRPGELPSGPTIV
jgi:CRISPR-associated protein Cas2